MLIVAFGRPVHVQHDHAWLKLLHAGMLCFLCHVKLLYACTRDSKLLLCTMMHCHSGMFGCSILQ